MYFLLLIILKLYKKSNYYTKKINKQHNKKALYYNNILHSADFGADGSDFEKIITGGKNPESFRCIIGVKLLFYGEFQAMMSGACVRP